MIVGGRKPDAPLWNGRALRTSVNDFRSNNGGRRRPLAVIGVVMVLAIAGGVAVWTAAGRSVGQGGHSSGGDVAVEDPPIDNGKLALSDFEAKYLQDAEHLGGFVLGDLTLPKLGAAIGDGDEDAWRVFCRKTSLARCSSPSQGRSRCSKWPMCEHGGHPETRPGRLTLVDLSHR